MYRRIFRAVGNSIIIALPTLVFVGFAYRTSLRTSLAWAAITALSSLIYKTARKQPLLPATVGLLIVGACIGMALSLGQQRAFFLLPAIILPVAIGLTILVSLMMKRPLAGILLNDLAGGPERWRQDHDYQSLYRSVTWMCFAVNALSGLVQRALYIKNLLLGLATVHVLVPAVFSMIIAFALIRVHRLNYERVLNTSG